MQVLLHLLVAGVQVVSMPLLGDVGPSGLSRYATLLHRWLSCLRCPAFSGTFPEDSEVLRCPEDRVARCDHRGEDCPNAPAIVKRAAEIGLPVASRPRTTPRPSVPIRDVFETPLGNGRNPAKTPQPPRFPFRYQPPETSRRPRVSGRGAPLAFPLTQLGTDPRPPG